MAPSETEKPVVFHRVSRMSLLQRGVAEEDALSVSREWTDEIHSREISMLDQRDADSARVLLKPMPATMMIVDGRPTPVPARGVLDCWMRDLRRETAWRMDCTIDNLNFRIPRGALANWAEDAGVRRFGGLNYRDGATRVDDTLRSFGMALLPSLEHPERASALFVDYVLLGVCGYLAQTLGAAQPRLVRRGGLASWQERRAKEMIEDGIRTQVPLKALADECRLSVSHFTKAFRETTGVTPHQWLLERRIDQAVVHMTTTDSSLSEIAVACGFADQSHFTRAFSKVIGMAPGVWRRTHGIRHMPAPEPEPEQEWPSGTPSDQSLQSFRQIASR